MIVVKIGLGVVLSENVSMFVIVATADASVRNAIQLVQFLLFALMDLPFPIHTFRIINSIIIQKPWLLLPLTKKHNKHASCNPHISHGV